jgi:signal transduction histidine kinase
MPENEGPALAIAEQVMKTTRTLRWILSAAGILLAAVDIFIAVALGLRFEANGRDVTLLVWVYLAASFGVLGFLIGYLVEVRRREQRGAAVIREQAERLAQNEKLASLGQLAAAIAHEVRNPLAIIRSSVQNVAETLPDSAGETRRACSFVTEEIDRLTRVTSTLLHFVRPLRVESRDVAVAALFEQVALLAAQMLAPKELRLHREAAPGLPALRADADLTCQVLLGLIANAAEATPRAGEIRLSAAHSDGRIELAVSDAGSGVAQDLRAKIFEPFFTTREGGTGLGLAVARQIVQAQGGTIRVGDAEGGGARFVVTLPSAAAVSS